MKFVFTLIALLWSFELPAQEAEDLKGRWEVREAALSDAFEYDAQTASQLLQIAEALQGSILELKKNGRASFLTKVPQLRIENAKWTYDIEKGSLKLVAQDDKTGNMELLVFHEEQGIMAYIAESPFILHLKKINED